jgi:hypothetical protein
MKNNYSISQRNQIVEAHLWCIDAVMKHNVQVIKTARLDRDDVYQQLAVRLIKAVAGYDPDKGKLRQHIFAQLQYELLSCKNIRQLTGFTGAPDDLRGKIVSIDAFREESARYAQLAAA